jgi:hypothetical protein
VVDSSSDPGRDEMVALRRLDGVDGVDEGLRFTDGMVGGLVGGAVSWKERGQESRISKGKG